MQNNYYTNDYGFYIYYNDDNSNQNNRIVFNSAAGIQVFINSSVNTSFEKNEYHYAINTFDTRNATPNLRGTLIDDDGNVFNNNTVPTSHVSSANATYNLRIGARTSDGLFALNGYIAEIVIFNYLLDAGQITQMTDYIDNKYGVL